MNVNFQKPKLLVILGPTAVGKTKLAINIAKKVGGVILSADSLQVYKYFDIGTAKPSIHELGQIPHYMIDLVYPDEDFNAGMFRNTALDLIDGFSKEGKKIIVVGGTFLYVKVLISGLIEHIEVDQEIRDEIESLKEKKGIKYLYERLEKVDPKSSKKIHPNDYIRIQRALEVFYLTGVTMSGFQDRHNFQENQFNVLKIGLNIEREILRSKIDQRVEEMFGQGFLGEVKDIRDKGFSPQLKPMKSIGYKEVNQILDNEITIERAKEFIKRDTKRLAKRQLTWLRKERELNWYDSLALDKILKRSEQFYS